MIKLITLKENIYFSVLRGAIMCINTLSNGVIFKFINNNNMCKSLSQRSLTKSLNKIMMMLFGIEFGFRFKNRKYSSISYYATKSDSDSILKNFNIYNTISLAIETILITLALYNNSSLTMDYVKKININCGDDIDMNIILHKDTPIDLCDNLEKNIITTIQQSNIVKITEKYEKNLIIKLIKNVF